MDLIIKYMDFIVTFLIGLFCGFCVCMMIVVLYLDLKIEDSEDELLL